MSARTPTRILVGVGVGPGDPELVTVKAVRVLQRADVVLVPVMDAGEQGHAEATVRAHLDHDRVRRAVFALNERQDTPRREAAWEAAADAVVAAYDDGAETVAFATIGDPNVYSTFSYLAQTVRSRLPDVTVESVPGITAMQDLAARSGTVLCEGTETLALVPLTAGVERLRAALESADTVVAYKGGRHLDDMLQVLRDADRLADAVYGERLGLPGEEIGPVDEHTGAAPYLSTLMVPARRDRRGGKL